MNLKESFRFNFFSLPIFWSYLLSQFLKITILCVMAFIVILLTMQLDEIAHFAALGAPLSYILVFTIYQIPYILPIAIPISCLIASLILIQQLSTTGELTAFRACGFSFRDLLTPLFLMATLLALCNFWIISEVATQSHLTTNLLKNELRSINPLLLLNNKHLMRMKGLFFTALGPSRLGELASDTILVIPNTNQERLHLLVASQLKSTPVAFIGKKVSLISTIDAKHEGARDHLLIENMDDFVTFTSDFSHFLQKKVWTIHSDYLQLPLLLVHIKEQKRALALASEKGAEKNEIKNLKHQLNRSYSEITRRFSISFAAFSFTLMGTAFGINISRKKRSRGLYLAIGLSAFYLASYFAAKSIDQNWFLSTTLYFLPHCIIVITSLFLLRRANRGKE